MISPLYKPVSIILAVLLALSVTSALYFRGRVTSVQLDLQVEKTTTAELRGKIGTQNAAVDTMRQQCEASQKDYRAAMKAAEDTSVKVGSLAAQLAAMRKAGGHTCTDAMPIVNRALEGLK